MFEEKTLICKDCGEEFIFTVGEQEFFASKGLENEPKRCKKCRDAKRNAAKTPREFFTTVCAECGGEAKVPFQPNNEKPVYCSECFAKKNQQ
ncbi:MAG: zinc-ribbon domain containing protein [Clostridia bacterium]|nr:zinc-ribbon domain containing protein [Clostridia bacterium]